MSVTAARGFVAHGLAAGIKASGAPDLALVATADRRPVPAAAVFTPNRMAAAPVQVSRFNLSQSGGHAAGVVLNAGNANAATGRGGRATAEGSCTLVAQHLGCAGTEVLVCSTGLIGIPMALDPIREATPALVAGLAGDAAAGERAARAIMTTDTRPKQSAVAGAGFTVGGMAKGAAMLAPDMATMLAVLTTDAAATPAELTTMLRAAVAGSFNRISSDGCASTNDTVILLASGEAGATDRDALAGALAEACADLAQQMVDDAEGATKVVRVTVRGAASDEEAARGARQVADSQLVKCSWYGADPYWGRIASELGVAGIVFDPDRLSISYGGVEVCRGGVAVDHDAAAVAAHMAGRHLEVVADLGVGTGEWWLLTNDLTHGYIDENMRTS